MTRGAPKRGGPADSETSTTAGNFCHPRPRNRRRVSILRSRPKTAAEPYRQGAQDCPCLGKRAAPKPPPPITTDNRHLSLGSICSELRAEPVIEFKRPPERGGRWTQTKPSKTSFSSPQRTSRSPCVPTRLIIPSLSSERITMSNGNCCPILTPGLSCPLIPGAPWQTDIGLHLYVFLPVPYASTFFQFRIPPLFPYSCMTCYYNLSFLFVFSMSPTHIRAFRLPFIFHTGLSARALRADSFLALDILACS